MKKDFIKNTRNLRRTQNVDFPSRNRLLLESCEKAFFKTLTGSLVDKSFKKRIYLKKRTKEIKLGIFERNLDKCISIKFAQFNNIYSITTYTQ